MERQASKTKKFHPRNNRKKQSPRNNVKKNNLSSSINPSDLIKKATKTEEQQYQSAMLYSDFTLNSMLAKNIAAKGYERPTEIQEKSIDQLIEGRDMIGIAATGTGKTGAFLIPIVNQMLMDPEARALVVVPTRELAQQVDEEYRSLTKQMNLLSGCFIGGTNVNKDVQLARRKHRFVVATPGRLNDLIERKAIRLGGFSVLVLDEFDRMLDMGFIHDVRKIGKILSNRKQTMLFSATLDKSQESLIKEFVTNPVRVQVNTGTESSENVHQDIIKVDESENKFDVLLKLIKGKSFEKVMLFAETKRTADKVCKQLKKHGLLADVIHGNKSQNYRTKAINSFKKGTTKILVATDVAARGIDVDNVTHVVNYQLPRTMDSYIHRIGRTGRAGKVGQAFTFIN